jgi:predicted MPP superfamily phosphohydrolase
VLFFANFRVILFVSAVATVYALAALLLAEDGWRWITGKPKAATPPWVRRSVFSAAAAGLLCMAYGYWIEPYWPEVTRHRMAIPNLPKGVTLRLVLLSDLHCDPEARLEPRLPALVESAQPDVIVFAGDALNDERGLPTFKTLMSRLARLAPVFAVRGNWDVRYWSKLDLYGGTGVRLLNREAVPLRLRDVDLWIAGAAAGDEDGLRQALANIPPGALSIVVDHWPDDIEEIARHRATLVCAGHTHGGQVALPFYGALVTLSRFDKKFESGLFRVSDTWMYVNRGIGMEGGFAPRVRFCARPEVTVLDLVP